MWRPNHWQWFLKTKLYTIRRDFLNLSFCQFPSNRRQSLHFTIRPLNRHELVTGDTYARRGRICIKLVYNKKTRCNEDQTRKHTGKFYKEAKALPSTKARSNMVRLRSALERRVFEIPAFAERNQMSPFIGHLPSNLVLVLNSNRIFLMARSHAGPRQYLNTKTLQKHECFYTEKLNFMCWKPTLKGIHEAAIPGTLFRTSSSEVTHQLQTPIQAVQWILPGNIPEDQQVLHLNESLIYKNLMMPTSR